MKKIICPIDFSETANNAIEYAAKLAPYLEAELVLFHVISEPSLQDISNINSGIAPEHEKENEAKERLEKYVAMIKETFSVSCEVVVHPYVSDVDKAIVKETATNLYDLAVMGTNGVSDIGQLFLGTHTNHVVGKTSCPVLVVPDGCSFKELNQIVYASNYKTEDVSIIQDLVNLTAAFNPEITVLHVDKKQSEVNEEVMLLIQDLYSDKLKGEIEFVQVVADDVVMAIDDYMDDNKGDLLVLLTHQYSWIENIFRTSVAKKINLVADYPILINRESKA